MANKDLLDPRQALFLGYYLKPGTDTFNNIYQSALKAGYSESYADNFRKSEREWMSGHVGEITKEELVKKSKRVLNKTLDGDDLKLAQDTAKFVAKTDIEFSEKQDITSGGNALTPVLVRFVGKDDKPTD